ncbi:hypothetical protein Tco_0126865 [Tanacetum coccineum]
MGRSGIRIRGMLLQDQQHKIWLEMIRQGGLVFETKQRASPFVSLVFDQWRWMFSVLGCTDVAIGGWTILVRYDPPPQVTQLCSTAFTGAGAGVWFFLSRINALTISFSSAISDETAGVEELVLTLETMALLRD